MILEFYFIILKSVNKYGLFPTSKIFNKLSQNNMFNIL